MTRPNPPSRSLRRGSIALRISVVAGATFVAWVLHMVLIGALYNTWEATLIARAGSLAFTGHHPDIPGLILELQDPNAPPASGLLPLPVYPDLYNQLYTLTPPGSSTRHLAVAIEVFPAGEQHPVIAIAAIPASVVWPEALALNVFILTFTLLPAVLLVVVWPLPPSQRNANETARSPA